MEYATQWFDPAVKPAANESTKKIGFEEVQRLAKLLALATAAETIPRRVGHDATRAERSLDKKRCRRIAHVASQLLDGWSKTETQTLRASTAVAQATDAGIRREAATIDWARWWPEHRIWLENRRRYIATWASMSGVSESWAKSALVKINSEISWLEYAMR